MTWKPKASDWHGMMIGDGAAIFWEETKGMGSLSEWRSVGDDRLRFKIPEGSGQGVQWAELLFTKSHTTGTREHPMVLVQGELKIDRSTSLHSKKQTFRTCNQMRFFISFFISFLEKNFRHILLLIPSCGLVKTSQGLDCLWYVTQEPDLCLIVTQHLQLLPCIMNLGTRSVLLTLDHYSITCHSVSVFFQYLPFFPWR